MIDPDADAPVSQSYIEQLKGLGVEADEIEQYQQKQNQRSIFWVLPENWQAVNLFKRSLTQLVYSGINNQVTGFNYAGVDVVMKNMQVSEDVFEQFQFMEKVALQFWRERAD